MDSLARPALTISATRATLPYYNNRVDETIKGIPVTEELIAKLADEAERGYDVEGLRRRGRPRLGSAEGPSAVVPVRMDDELLAALAERAEHDGLSRSEAIREAVRAWAHAS